MIALAVILLAGIATLGIDRLAFGQDPSQPQVTITSPTNEATVAAGFPLSGKDYNIPPGSQLRVAVFPESQQKWYPSVEVTREPGGDWSVPRNDVCPASGQQGIYIVEVPDSKAYVYSNYINEVLHDKNFKNIGLSSIPGKKLAFALVNIPKNKDKCA